jgi:hypothetical protein
VLWVVQSAAQTLRIIQRSIGFNQSINQSINQPGHCQGPIHAAQTNACVRAKRLEQQRRGAKHLSHSLLWVFLLASRARLFPGAKRPKRVGGPMKTTTELACRLLGQKKEEAHPPQKWLVSTLVAGFSFLFVLQCQGNRPPLFPPGVSPLSSLLSPLPGQTHTRVSTCSHACESSCC